MLLMLPVLTLLVASPVPVTRDTLEMALSAQVSVIRSFPLLFNELCTQAAAGQSTGVLVGAVAGASISTAFIILIILMIVVIAMRRNRQASLELKLE